MMWDFWSLAPESLHQVTILFSDCGTPRGFRHANGYFSHTFSLVNAQGQRAWCKWHFRTMQGIENFHREEAIGMLGDDPDFSARDWFEAIERGEFPKWRVCVQIMDDGQASAFPYNPFDLTKVSPQKQFPLHEVGVMMLNRIRRATSKKWSRRLSRPPILSGIGYSPDKMLQARILSNPDAHRHRMGVNYDFLPINKAKCPVHTYHRDGHIRFDENGGREPNYEPNSFGGPEEDRHFRDFSWGLSL
jgi:catalase